MAVNDSPVDTQSCYQQAVKTLNFKKLERGEQCELSVHTGAKSTRHYLVQRLHNKLTLIRTRQFFKNDTEFTLTDQLPYDTHEYQLLKTISLQASITFLQVELFTSSVPLDDSKLSIINSLEAEKAASLLSSEYLQKTPPNVDGLAQTLKNLDEKVAHSVFQHLSTENKLALLHSRNWYNSQLHAQLFFKLTLEEQQCFVTQAAPQELEVFFNNVQLLVQDKEMECDDWEKVDACETQTEETQYTTQLTRLFDSLQSTTDVKEKLEQSIFQLSVPVFANFTELFPNTMQQAWLLGYLSAANDLAPHQALIASRICSLPLTEAIRVLNQLATKPLIQVLTTMDADQALVYLKQPELNQKQADIQTHLFNLLAQTPIASKKRPVCHKLLELRSPAPVAMLCFYFTPISFEAFLGQLSPEEAKAIVNQLTFLADQSKHASQPELLSRLPTEYLVELSREQQQSQVDMLRQMSPLTAMRVMSEWLPDDWDHFFPTNDACLLRVLKPFSPSTRQTLIRRIPWRHWQALVIRLINCPLDTITDFTYDLHFNTWWQCNCPAEQLKMFNQQSPSFQRGCLLFLSYEKLLNLIVASPASSLGLMIDRFPSHPKLIHFLIFLGKEHPERLQAACDWLSEQYSHFDETEGLMEACYNADVPAVTHYVAKLYQSEPFVNKIARAYRSHKERLDLIHQSNDAIIVAAGKQPQGPTYYYDKEKIFPPMRHPSGTKDLVGFHRYGVPHGGAKQVTTQDDHYIALEENISKHRRNGVFQIKLLTTEQTHKTRNIFEEIHTSLGKPRLEDSCFTPGLLGVITENEQILAVRGGVDVTSYVNSHGSLPLVTFKSLTAQVAKLHEADIVHRDFKPENILIRDSVSVDGKRVWLPSIQLKVIDCDGAITRSSGQPRNSAYTIAYITRSLLVNRGRERRSSGLTINVSSENYALLLTILFAVSEEFRALPLCHPKEENRQYSVDRMFEVGILKEYQKWPPLEKALMKILEQYIVPKHLNKVVRFLTNPFLNRLPIPLHNVFNWQA
ncbi:hypothetical protein [Parashewanella tropica]|uniref:hypothetical protein n=1 Tax=Parashewanella tropica TaxID=2547970 RepID=UPI00105926D3|nr:hypothetical protein [Parashewanella tropica]